MTIITNLDREEKLPRVCPVGLRNKRDTGGMDSASLLPSQWVVGSGAARGLLSITCEPEKCVKWWRHPLLPGKGCTPHTAPAGITPREAASPCPWWGAAGKRHFPWEIKLFISSWSKVLVFVLTCDRNSWFCFGKAWKDPPNNQLITRSFLLPPLNHTVFPVAFPNSPQPFPALSFASLCTFSEHYRGSASPPVMNKAAQPPR